MEAVRRIPPIPGPCEAASGIWMMSSSQRAAMNSRGQRRGRRATEKDTRTGGAPVALPPPALHPELGALGPPSWGSILFSSILEIVLGIVYPGSTRLRRLWAGQHSVTASFWVNRPSVNEVHNYDYYSPKVMVRVGPSRMGLLPCLPESGLWSHGRTVCFLPPGRVSLPCHEHSGAQTPCSVGESKD